MSSATKRIWGALLLAVVAATWPSAATAQTGPLKLDLPGVGTKLGAGDKTPPATITATFTAPEAGKPGLLYVTANIRPSYHIYSVTQGSTAKGGGPLKTVIALEASDRFQLLGDFRPTTEPKIHVDQDAWKGLKLEEHEGTVTWTAPLQLSAGIDAATLQIAGTVDIQACNQNGCLPPETLPFTALLAAGPPTLSQVAPSQPVSEGNATPADKATSVGEYRASRSSVLIRGHVEPAVAAPGSVVTLVITAEPDSGWHIYAAAERDPNVVGKGKPTLIVLDGDSGAKLVSLTASGEPTQKQSPIPGVGTEAYHTGPTTWRAKIEIPQNANGTFPLSGLIGYQVCSDSGCQMPLAAKFRADISIDGIAANATAQSPLTFSEARYGEVAKLAAARPANAVALNVESASIDEAGASNLAGMILLGFAGGLLLNLMPCVLPVIGLKVLSFIEQAGQNRREALLLNVWYSVGIVAVFLTLAATAVIFGFAWGEQFSSDAFNITLAAIVFAMSLSLLGVWEIPIPGFVGGSTANTIASKEGPAGAVFKGVLTTVLATPCTGPFMGTALAWAVRQPAAYTFCVFGSIGLGMASPYLLVGAFPQLIRFLPKPGAWMGTFKQIMGFVLLGTVIFLLSFIHPALLVQTVTLLTGIGLACWWIARTPLYADLSKQVLAWVQGAVVVAATAMFAFGWLDNVMQSRFGKYAKETSTHVAGANELAWQPFSPERLQQLTDAGQTVMVDFTADWCLICKVLENTVLNTGEVKEVVEQNGIVPLVADFTRRPPEIKQMLENLDSNAVPVLAIFPNGRMDQPIVFRGPYTQATLIEALRQAGPSRSDAPPARTAMTER